jgi:hypothetical protein
VYGVNRRFVCFRSFSLAERYIRETSCAVRTGNSKTFASTSVRMCSSRSVISFHFLFVLNDLHFFLITECSNTTAEIFMLECTERNCLRDPAGSFYKLHCKRMSRDSSVDIATKLCAGRPRGWFPVGARDSSLLHIILTGSGACQPPIQWVPETFSPGVKRHVREADHSPRSSAEVKNGGAIPSLPHAS